MKSKHFNGLMEVKKKINNKSQKTQTMTEWKRRYYFLENERVE